MNDGFVAYGPTPELRAAMTRALDRALATASPGFADAMREAQRAVQEAEPVVLMGALAMYFGTSEEGTNPEFTRVDGVFWHHIELAQAFAFRSAPTGLRRPKALLEVVDDVTRAIKRLAEAWILLEAKKIEVAPVGREQDLAAALVHLRVNSMALRGWAYTTRFVPLLEDLLRPLDVEFADALGWRPSALPRWWLAMGDALNARLAAHRSTVHEASAWAVDASWLGRVRERFGAPSVDDDDAFTAAAAADEEFRRNFVFHSSDLRAHEIFRFDIDELVGMLAGGDVGVEAVRDILGAWSMAPGDDGGVEPGRLFVENPVVGRPFVATGTDQWHLFCPWLLLHNPFELLERVIDGDSALFDRYMQRRAEFLETRTASALSRALPGANVETGLLYVDPADGREYENDALAVLDSYAVVAEAKAGRLGPEARRGVRRRLRDRIAALVDHPSEQSQRLAEILVAGTGPQPFQRKTTGSGPEVDLGAIRRALTLGVTLEPIAGLLPRLSEVAESGLSERTAEALAYSISLPDLELVVDVLRHPSEVLHYLGRRAEIERRHFLEGDEVDLLGLYLRTGFNLGEKEFDGEHVLNVTGMSDPIDAWHYREEAGLQAERPEVERTPWFEAMLTRIENRRGPRWPEIGVTLCNVAPPEQRQLRTAMGQLRKEILSGERPATDLLVFHNGPAQRRDTFVGVIAASADRNERTLQYEQAARIAMGANDLDRVILLAWTPVPISAPYFALVYFDRTG